MGIKPLYERGLKRLGTHGHSIMRLLGYDDQKDKSPRLNRVWCKRQLWPSKLETCSGVVTLNNAIFLDRLGCLFGATGFVL